MALTDHHDWIKIRQPYLPRFMDGEDYEPYYGRPRPGAGSRGRLIWPLISTLPGQGTRLSHVEAFWSLLSGGNSGKVGWVDWRLRSTLRYAWVPERIHTG